MPKGYETQEVHWKNTGKTTGYKQFNFPAALLPSLFFALFAPQSVPSKFFQWLTVTPNVCSE